MRTSWALAAVMLGSACGDKLEGPDLDPAADVNARFDVGASDFWSAPFPSDHRVREDSRKPDMTGFPNPDDVGLVGELVDLADDGSQGFSLSGAVYLPLDGPIAEGQLPDRDGSVREDALVFLMDIDEDSPSTGERMRADIAYRTTVSPYGPEHALVALPIQGLPLRPRTRYAMVALRPLSGEGGVGVGTPPALQQLVDGLSPEGWRDDVIEQYLDALRVLELQGIDPEDIAGLTVFTTNRPTKDFFDQAAEVRRVCDDAQAYTSTCPLRYVGPPVGRPSAIGFVVDEITDDFCVYEGRMLARSYQEGEPPYEVGEGGWIYDDDGVLEEQKQEFGRLWISVPRSAVPGSKLPAIVFVRTGGGGDRPMLDRGIRTEAGTDVATLTGYVNEFTQAGWIGVMYDGPLGGERNPDGGDEQFAIFDIDNPVALRDNLRQSALELVAMPYVLERINLSAAGCPFDGIEGDGSTSPSVRIDTDQLAVFGHSMGATIAPLAIAAQPLYRHVVLSGSGGSWIDNIVYKEKPIPTAPLAATLLQEGDITLVDRFHPVLTLLQWMGEPAESYLYAPRYGKEAGRSQRSDVLMVQGIVDRYILPPMANSMVLATGLDAAGPLYDKEDTPQFPTVESVLPYIDGEVLSLPVAGNRQDGGRAVTNVVIQHREDGVEGGHEVAYQKPNARWQVRCFLQTLREGDVGVVGGSGTGDDPCDEAPGE